jgi:hypothetical protein
MSDHNPLILRSNTGEIRKTKQFCFETAWVKHPEFSEKIAEIWSRGITTRNAVEKWHIKLSRVKKFLKGWGQNIKRHTRGYKILLKEELTNLEKRGRRKHDCFLIGKENIYSNRTVEGVGRRGIVLAQKVQPNRAVTGGQQYIILSQIYQWEKDKEYDLPDGEGRQYLTQRRRYVGTCNKIL